MLVKSWLFYLWRKPVKLTDLSWKSHSNLWHVKNTSMTIIIVYLAYYSMGAYNFFYFLHISYILFLSQIRTLDFKRRMSFSFCLCLILWSEGWLSVFFFISVKLLNITVWILFYNLYICIFRYLWWLFYIAIWIVCLP